MQRTIQFILMSSSNTKICSHRDGEVAEIRRGMLVLDLPVARLVALNRRHGHTRRTKECRPLLSSHDRLLLGWPESYLDGEAGTGLRKNYAQMKLGWRVSARRQSRGLVCKRTCRAVAVLTTRMMPCNRDDNTTYHGPIPLGIHNDQIILTAHTGHQDRKPPHHRDNEV